MQKNTNFIESRTQLKIALIRQCYHTNNIKAKDIE